MPLSLEFYLHGRFNIYHRKTGVSFRSINVKKKLERREEGGVRINRRGGRDIGREKRGKRYRGREKGRGKRGTEER